MLLQAVRAARAALSGPWSKLTPTARAGLMHKLADLMQRDLEELAALETLDCGKPLSESRASDLPSSIDCIRYYAGWTDKIYGQTSAFALSISNCY